jgi:acylphosphatase
MPCVHCFVYGRVQGVFFRASAREEAERLGISGWARNLPDGRVEVMACGGEGQLAAFREWLWQGPPLAKVANVACAPAPESEFVGFNTRR